MLDTDLAYLAGAMDSDGYFSIKKSTYHQRIRNDANNAVYSEKIGLKQITPDVPQMLHQHFGGCMSFAKGQTENSKPLHVWTATDKNAAEACCLLLPFLRVKRCQADRLIELRKSKGEPYGQFGYWFEQEFPGWRTMELLTTTEVVTILGYAGPGMVSQAVRNGTLLSLPYDHSPSEKPRVPRLLVERLRDHAAQSKDGRGRNRPAQLIAWRERLWLEVRELNKIGVNGTPVYHRTGAYKMV